MARGRQELRCTCSRRPLLAIYGLDTDGQPFLHMKVYKGNRLYAEAVFTGGTARLHCRECLHWHVIRIRGREPHMNSEELPEQIPASMLAETTRR